MIRFLLTLMCSFLILGCQPVQSNSQPDPTLEELQIPLNADSETFSTVVRNASMESGFSGKITKLADDTIVLRQRNEDKEKEVELKFWNHWLVELAIKSDGLDISPFTETGSLVMDINPHNVSGAALEVRIGCELRCQHPFELREWAKKNEGKGWKTIAIPVSCLAPSQDPNAISSVFVLRTGGKGKIAIRNLRFSNTAIDPMSCPSDLSKTPVVLDEFWSAEWWMPRHKLKLEEVKKVNADVVLIGDSITHGWEDAGKQAWESRFEDITTLNLGFSGDRTENVLWRLEHGELANQDAPLTFILIGTNNTGHRFEKPEKIRDGVAAIIDKVKAQMPRTHIVLHAIFPRGTTDEDPLRQNNETTNQLLSELAYKKDIEFLNLNRAFLREDGVLTDAIMTDFLHPNEAGYEIWAKELVPIINKYVRKKGAE